MKLSNFIFVCNEHSHDVDVVTDYSEDLYICYCGDKSFHLTEEGQKEFAEIMNLEVEWTEGKSLAFIKINNLENAEELNDKLCLFFSAAAGYVSTKLYDKWFTFE